MPLSLPFSILLKMDDDIDMDELECMLANLIYQGLVKGYITFAFEQRVLVMHKEIEKAFPNLN